MARATDAHRKQRLQDESIEEVKRRDSELKIVRDQILDLNDKFDYYIMLKMKKGQLKSSQLQKLPKSSRSPVHSPKASHPFRSTGTQKLRLQQQEEDNQRLREQFKRYSKNAKEWNLGNREQYRTGELSKDNRLWLDRLAALQNDEENKNTSIYASFGGSKSPSMVLRGNDKEEKKVEIEAARESTPLVLTVGSAEGEAQLSRLSEVKTSTINDSLRASIALQLKEEADRDKTIAYDIKENEE